jgi:hypothetical protein
MFRSVALGVLIGACRTDGGEDPPPTGSIPTLELTAVDPAVVDPLGGSRLTLFGEGFADGVEEVSIGGVVAAEVVVLSDVELQFVSSPMPAGPDLDVRVERGSLSATLFGAVEAWSPAELPGARLFDAAVGAAVEEPATSYEWQRLTAELHPDWKARDGNTVTWLPSVGRFIAVAGWNPLQEPDGFVPVEAYSASPPLNTTDEVWSSADGVTWTNDLPHGNGAFERRHVHGVSLWNDRLWMIGGDTHQGYYNHDVVSSADGVSWRVELGPGTTEPPWAERGLQMSGVFDGKLWMAGGQDLLGDPADYVFHNDVWSTEDGVNWTEVAPDAPASDTRWAGCGMVTGLVEFQGRMWLVGCAQYRENEVGTTMSNEVWSTTDGLVWQRHADPPWVGKAWPDVVVWDGKLWILFGYTYGDFPNGWTAGNANEAWFSEDGESWESLPPDMPVPGSHAQGVAVTDDFLLLAGGNHTFGTLVTFDKSVWRLVPFRGDALREWTDRGADGLVVRALTDEARPLWVPDAFGPGAAGVQFDGSRSVLVLDEVDTQAAGRSVFWVARAPYLPAPWGWEETYAPLGTVVGGPVDYGWMPRSSVGLSGGQVALLNLNDARGVYGEPVFTRITGGDGLQEGTGAVRFAGVTHAADGAVQVWVDGLAAGPSASADYGVPRAWSELGGSIDDTYYGPNTRLAGTVGAVVVLPEAADAATVARVHAWARGRFAAP